VKVIMTIIKFVAILFVSILAAGIGMGNVQDEEDIDDSFGSHSDNTDWGSLDLDFDDGDDEAADTI